MDWQVSTKTTKKDAKKPERMILNNPKPQKLTVTMHYTSQTELNGMMERVKSLVRNGSICHEEKHGKESRYCMNVENMDEVSLTANFNILEETDFIEVTPRVEIINGKKCLIFKSNMDLIV